MRNLKKILALVLALMMTLSLMVTANASSYTDADQVSDKYEEAVEVLSALGVFQGDDKGQLLPNKTLSRKEAAVLVYRLLSGDVEDDYLNNYKGYAAKEFSDVSASAWYEPYVAYAVNGNYIKGDGKGHFNPDDDIKGTEVLTILLRAVGYDQNDEFSENWPVTVATLAKQLGVTNTVNGVLLTKAVTREVVAELIFQTIAYVDMVNYTPAFGYQPITLTGNSWNHLGAKKTVTLGWDVFGLNRVEGTVTQDKTNVTVKGTEDYAETLPSTVSVKVSGSEVFETGRAAYVWTTEDAWGNHTALTGVYYTDTVLATKYNAAFSKWTTAATQYIPASSDFVASLDNYKVYVNGSLNNTYSYKVGDEVRLIDSDGNGKIDLILVRDEVVDVVTGAVTSTTGANNKTYITVPGVITVKTLASAVSGYENLVKGDVVLVVTPYTGVTYLTKAAVVNGTKTLYSTTNPDYITFAGNNYYRSGLTGTSVTSLFSNTTNTFGVEYNLYLDRGGYAIYEAEVTSASTYAVVLDAGYQLGTTVGTFNQVTYYATLLYLDGTTGTIEVDKLYRTTALSGDNNSNNTNVVAAGSEYIGHFVKIGTGLNSSKGTYTNALTPAHAGTHTGTVTITNGNPNFGIANTSQNAPYYANNETVYLVLNSDGSISRYVGYANVPSMTGASYCIMTNGTYTRLAEYVFINYATATDSNTYYVWALNGGYRTNTGYVDGVLKTIYTYTGLYQDGSSIAINDLTLNTLTANTYYKVTVVNGEATFSTVSNVAANKTVGYIDYSTETIKTGDVTYARTYSTSTVAVYDVSDGVLVPTTVAAVSAGDKVTLVLDATGTNVTAIYKLADNGTITVTAVNNLKLSTSTNGSTISFSAVAAAPYTEGQTVAITAMHDSSTFGSGYKFTITLNTGDSLTVVGNNTNSLTFNVPVSQAMLDQGTVYVVSVSHATV